MSNPIRGQYRQGDVLIQEVNPQDHFHLRDAQWKPVKGAILALGEVTGHAHRVSSKYPLEMYVHPHTGTLYLKALEPGTQVTHEEHGPIDLEVGKVYQIRTKSEFDPEFGGD